MAGIDFRIEEGGPLFSATINTDRVGDRLGFEGDDRPEGRDAGRPPWERRSKISRLETGSEPGWGGNSPAGEAID
jgi:hypothetical protein